MLFGLFSNIVTTNIIIYTRYLQMHLYFHILTIFAKYMNIMIHSNKNNRYLEYLFIF